MSTNTSGFGCVEVSVGPHGDVGWLGGRMLGRGGAKSEEEWESLRCMTDTALESAVISD